MGLLEHPRQHMHGPKEQVYTKIPTHRHGHGHGPRPRGSTIFCATPLGRTDSSVRQLPAPTPPCRRPVSHYCDHPDCDAYAVAIARKASGVRVARAQPAVFATISYIVLGDTISNCIRMRTEIENKLSVFLLFILYWRSTHHSLLAVHPSW